MATAAQRPVYTVSEPALHIGLELGEGKWKLAFTVSLGDKSRTRTIDARDLIKLGKEIRAARKHFGLPQNAAVRSCYEAGRDGFWVHRALEKLGIENQVLDSASIKVDRKAKRRKTDRLDADDLVSLLVKWYLGDKGCWHVVRVPTPEQEDARQLSRSMSTLKKERTRLVLRIKGLLAVSGFRIGVGPRFPEFLARAKNVLGEPVPPGLRQRIELEYERLVAVRQQLKTLESVRRRELSVGEGPVALKARKLFTMRGIGENGAWVFSSELFSWRTFQNRKQVGSLLGMTPTPFQSGDSHREQGIGKDGLRRVRALSVELAWCWLRFQPNSELSQWYNRRFADGGKRIRKIGIVALARKMTIAMWRWVEHDILPEGALLKP